MRMGLGGFVFRLFFPAVFLPFHRLVFQSGRVPFRVFLGSGVDVVVGKIISMFSFLFFCLCWLGGRPASRPSAGVGGLLEMAFSQGNDPVRYYGVVMIRDPFKIPTTNPTRSGNSSVYGGVGLSFCLC